MAQGEQNVVDALTKGASSLYVGRVARQGGRDLFLCARDPEAAARLAEARPVDRHMRPKDPATLDVVHAQSKELAALAASVGGVDVGLESPMRKTKTPA